MRRSVAEQRRCEPPARGVLHRTSVDAASQCRERYRVPGRTRLHQLGDGGPITVGARLFSPGLRAAQQRHRQPRAERARVSDHHRIVGWEVCELQQKNIASGIAGLKADTSALLPLVEDSAALRSEVNALVTAGHLPAATLANLKTALDSINVSSAAGQANRIHAAITLVLAAPEYITQKQVGVGMPVTQHPLHRSVRAALPHTAPALRRDDQTLVRVRVADE